MDELSQASLPPLSQLGPGKILRGTSAINLPVVGWPGADQCTANAAQAGTAVQLNSGLTELSAAWYGVRMEYNSLNVPFLPPYEALIHTDAGCEFWVAVSDCRRNAWAIMT